MTVGKVYLIGAGPGDPGLLTLRGAAVLAAADVVLYDALAHPSLLDYYARPDAERHDVGKRYGGQTFSQEAINAEIVALARSGKVVARLKGGDPMLFARGAEEIEALAREGIPFEIVPGVPSPTAAAAYAGIPLTHRDLSSSVAFITGTEAPGKERTAHDWSKLATATQTLCVVMGMRRIGEITRALVEHGRPKDTPVAVIEWGTWPRQRTIEGTLETIAERTAAAHISNPAVIVVGEVAGLRKGMRWYDTMPLFGKRLLVARPRHQAGKTADEILRRGAEPVLVPAIEIVAPPDPLPLRRAAAHLTDYDAVAFTSANAVDRLFAELASQDLDARAFGSALVSAIGPGTASSLEAHGIRPDVVARESRGEGLAATLLEALASRSHSGVTARATASATARATATSTASSSTAHSTESSQPTRTQRVLLPRALVARDALPDLLRAAGVEVDVVPAYATRAVTGPAKEALVRELDTGAIDAVLFTSGSTVSSLVAALGDRAQELLGKTVVGSIGPVTTSMATSLGIAIQVEAATYTVAALLDALAERLTLEAPRPSTKRG